ncbi:MAG TPA: hypothetical protein VM942_00925 [Acidimicrobiales bacterium]|nr:hypothetical protein [Acidimicrobiales bacterium]
MTPSGTAADDKDGRAGGQSPDGDEPPGDHHISTLPEPRPLSAVRRDRFGRRLFVTLLVAFLGLGALGVYGVRTREATATGGGYELTVTYSSVSRPGLATPWSAEIRRPGGFGEELVSLAVTASYFDSFDENGLDPDPAEAVNDGDRTIWRFDPPPGDVMTVSFDARLQPDVQLTRVKGSASVLDESDSPVVTVKFRTLAMP